MLNLRSNQKLSETQIQRIVSQIIKFLIKLKTSIIFSNQKPKKIRIIFFLIIKMYKQIIQKNSQ